ncbi:zinc-dependent alcohol dehydrogenase family protein [Methylobacillus sp.]|uniref:zinc-dependent alcohol dehydrogenase family protein n=1 Tax=Methylobacillus sp. TaxID=56818 RepID=UPI002FE1AB6A
MARVVQFDQVGGPEVLKVVDVPVRTPNAGEVRINVKAIGLNRAESMFRSGAYVVGPTFPGSGIGYEASGIIESVGAGVTGFAAGDAVSVIPAFMMNDYAMYGEQVVAPAFAVVKHPVGLSWEEAAATWMQYATVYGALVAIARLAKDDVLLIPAASSSVGLAAIQLANMVGAIPVALTRSEDKKQRLLEMGARHVIATDTQDIVAEVRRITNGAGARVVFDPVGGPVFGQLVQAAAPSGILIAYGALSPEPASLPFLDVFGKRLTIRGYELFEYTMDKVAIERVKTFIVDGLASGKLKPLVGKTFPLEEVVAAHRYLESNQQFGKIVLTV